VAQTADDLIDERTGKQDVERNVDPDGYKTGRPAAYRPENGCD
jgi:hypothetical protein